MLVSCYRKTEPNHQPKFGVKNRSKPTGNAKSHTETTLDMIEVYKFFNNICDSATTGWLTDRHVQINYDMRVRRHSLYQSQIRYDTYNTASLTEYSFSNRIEWLRERTEHLDIFLFFRPSLNGVLFPMFCLLVEGECQILVF